MEALELWWQLIDRETLDWAVVMQIGAAETASIRFRDQSADAKPVQSYRRDTVVVLSDDDGLVRW